MTAQTAGESSIYDVALTLRECDGFDDWYVIERAEHDGRSWLESTGPNSMSLRCSSRFSDADVEGTAEEMLEIAEAIETMGIVSFRRCAVDATGEHVRFHSPRNSQTDGITTSERALALAKEIREKIAAKPQKEGT